jgi:hypothetical protein
MYSRNVQYIDMYASMGKTSNTMIFSERPADINALMAQAATVLKAAGSTSTSTNSDSNSTNTSTGAGNK